MRGNQTLEAMYFSKLRWLLNYANQNQGSDPNPNPSQGSGPGPDGSQGPGGRPRYVVVDYPRIA